MAQATTVPFSGVKVLLESITTPGTYVAPCGLTERSISFNKDTSDTTVPDCDDEDAVAWLERDPVSKSVTISGEGVMARQSLARWQAAFDDADPTSCRIELTGTAVQGGGHYLGNFHMTSFEIGATRGERSTVSVTLESSGPVVFTPAA